MELQSLYDLASHENIEVLTCPMPKTGSMSLMQENGSCCNRLLRCCEQPAAGQLTLKCSAAAGNRFAPCRIYVFGHNGVRGCHCDR